MPAAPKEILELGGHEVAISNPDKVFFPATGATKMDLVRYFLAVAPGALAGCYDRPTLLKRYPNGVDAEPFFQKRVPSHRPEWIKTAHVAFPSGRTADFLAIQDTAHLIWAINLGCLELNPWNVRRTDTEHPDELRADLDPTPESSFDEARRVARIVRDVMAEHGLEGFPKTSGKRGIHVLARIEPRWGFGEVRRAALALAREVERRAPALVTTAWWKEERHGGVFVDYNQNARDRTLASAYSVRPSPDGRVSCPFAWDELEDLHPEELTMATVPERFARVGDPGARLDERAGSLESLLELAGREEREGLGDAPWPPHFPKQPGEARRAPPSKRRAPGERSARRRRA